MQVNIKLLKQCNLKCSYCFEREYFRDPRILSLSDMEIILNRIKAYALKEKKGQIELVYTGGEVLVLGEEYLESLFVLSSQIYKGTKIKIKLCIQTNLTLMNEKYIKLLKKFKVSVGTSFDIFGGQRRFGIGKPIYQVMIDKMIMMFKARIPFGAITVINKSNYKKGKEIYKFFNDISISFHTLKINYRFCPDLKITDDEYIKTLKDISKVRLEERKSKISMGIIDSYVRRLEGKPIHQSLCTFCKSCLDHLMFIENNGDVYPCCHLRYKELCLGNILHSSLGKIRNSLILEELKNRAEIIEKQCHRCKYVKICSGGCMADAYTEGDIMKKSKSWCKINRTMFAYIEKILRKKGKKLAAFN